MGKGGERNWACLFARACCIHHKGTLACVRQSSIQQEDNLMYRMYRFFGFKLKFVAFLHNHLSCVNYSSQFTYVRLVIELCQHGDSKLDIFFGRSILGHIESYHTNKVGTVSSGGQHSSPF